MRSKDLTVSGSHELPLARKADRTNVPIELIAKQPNFLGAIALCVQLSGLEDKEVYLTLGVDAGHWSRIMKAEAHFPVNKLGDLMDLCGNEAPLLWLANHRGYGLVVLESESERRAKDAERKLAEANSRIQWMTELLQGRAA